MKRLNYYQVHKNKQPRKLKFQTIKKKHIIFVISVNTKGIEKAMSNLENAMRKVQRNIFLFGEAIVQFEKQE